MKLHLKKNLTKAVNTIQRVKDNLGESIFMLKICMSKLVTV